MLQRFFIACAFASLVFISHPALAEMKIGVGTDLTGANASMGLQMRAGVEQAAADINAKGGINGEQLSVSLGDDRSDPKEAILVAEKFIGQDVKFVIGHLTSSGSIATSKEYAEGGVLEISSTATNPVFTDQGLWNTFRTAGRDDQQGQIAGEYILANFKDKKIAIVHDKAAYGKGLAEQTRKTLNAGGVKEVLYDGINPGEKDFSALVSRLKNLNVDILYYGGYYGEAGLILRQMRDQGMTNTVMIGGDGLYNDELGQIAGDGVIGTLMTFNADARKSPAAKAAVDAFKAKGVDSSGFVLPSYAAVQVLAQAVEAAHSTDPKKVAEVLRSGKTFDTVLGPISYDNKGDMTKANFVMYEWKKNASGKLVYVEKTAASQ
jgi:branched-chain amino acid transport system substrate-binding protein